MPVVRGLVSSCRTTSSSMAHRSQRLYHSIIHQLIIVIVVVVVIPDVVVVLAAYLARTCFGHSHNIVENSKGVFLGNPTPFVFTRSMERRVHRHMYGAPHQITA